MTVSVQIPTVAYAANGVTTVFAYPFDILNADDLKVSVDGVITTSGFTLTGVGVSGGGTVAFSSAPVSGTVLLYREVVLEREVDYQENGDLRAEVLDQDFDRIWHALQDQLLVASRTVRAPIGEVVAEMPAASSRALRVLGFDSLGQPAMLTRTEDGGAALALDLLNTTDPAKGAGMVRFALSAAGAAARSVLSRLRESVSVKDFGAVGDWNGSTGTDDTAAFTAAILHCRTNHVKLRIPAGRYRLTSAITFGTNGIGPYDGFDIEGDGQEGTELVLDFSGAVGIDVNPGSGGYTAFANSSVGGFRVFVPPGRAVDVPFYVKNSYNLNYHDLHVYAPLTSITSAFVGFRVSGACYFNQFSNLWVEVYGGDATVGKAYYIGNGRGDVGLAGANTSVNTFINCRTRGFGVGFDTVLANDTTFIGCDAEVCAFAFRDLSANGSRYLSCWQEGAVTAGLTIDRTTITNADGSTSTGSGSDYTVVEGGFWESIALDHAYRTRIKARYNSITTTANTEECDADSLNTSATHTGDGNDIRITKRVTTPIAHTVMSLGNRRYGYEFPNTAGPAKLLYSSSGDDLLMSAYRLNTVGSYRGWSQATDGTGSWVLSSWFTSTAIGSESAVRVMKANTSGVAFSINPFGATDNTVSCGTASNRWSVVYAGTGTINTSDERSKEQVQDIDAAALRAWAKVNYCQFKMVDAVAQKGSGARWHIGVIAQRVKEAFESEGLDAFSFGLLCYDEWGELTEPVLGDDGKPTGEDRVVREAGNRYGIRYEEALALECAYLRSRLEAA